VDEQRAAAASALIEQLCGMPAADAAALCDTAGFVAQPHGPNAILTADFRPSRIRLTVVDGVVRSGSYG
jgi:hypothetical protein